MNPIRPATRLGRQAQREVDALVVRLFFTVALMAVGILLVLVVAQFASYLPGWRDGAAALPVLVAGTVALARWLARRGHHRLGVTLALLAAVAVVTVIPLASGLGMRSMVLAFMSPLIILAGVMLGVSGALSFGALCTAATLAMPDVELAGPDRMPPGWPALGDQLLVDLSVIALSTFTGVLLSLALVRALRATKLHEHRFRQLLAIAADWYWEQDQAQTVTVVRNARDDALQDTAIDSSAVAHAGPAMLHDHLLDGLAKATSETAALQGRQPIRNVVVPCIDADGTPVHVSLSGEPITDESGGFRGYWGIGRRVTGEVEARRRLEANELLYRELFSRASTAFVLHRGGRILQVNPAAATMFGYGSPGELVGMSLFERIHPDHHGLPSQRLGALENSPIGTALPPIDLLTRTRDGMPLSVQASSVRIAMADGAANLSILADMTEREAAERALGEAKDHAEAASRGKSRFLANMSHEVRTPLNGIYGLAQLALEEDLPATRRHDYLRQIVSSAEHLTGLLSDVLDLSKIEAGEMMLERIVFDLRALLEAVANGYRGLAAEKSLSFALDIAADVPQWVRGDPTRTRQIVANYLSNALKFTSGGSITLSAKQAGEGCVRIAVNDTGIGIDPSIQERLFRPFTQADDSTTRRYGGTGLGLSICGELAVLLGGRVGIDSAPDKGSSFWVELPLHPADPCDGEPTSDLGAASIAATTLSGVHLLVVEDNPVNMMIAIAMLERWGARVTPASNGREALDVFEQAVDAFDAVLMDVHMPVMDGIDAAIQLRKRVSMDDLPIIAMTAAVLEQDLSEAFDAGMNDFVSKPFAADRLLATVVRWTVKRGGALGGRPRQRTEAGNPWSTAALTSHPAGG